MSSVERAEEGIMRGESIKRAAVSENASIDVRPPSIPAKDIKETVFADVVVVGSGIAGLTAALSAAEAGARTILLKRVLPLTIVASIMPPSPAGCRSKPGLK